ncbi:hypothetical protein CC78DRAFT_529907 [Lojkania enalia]|uniref:MI domain-containing protein n=1 Tax=Lojkania enalia TaxID=147567 RepID=A0A9P4KGW6_9PLEO|nr:hypothetical protein CC78DRAFT_529907 [Didymosphaeria enalia]
MRQRFGGPKLPSELRAQLGDPANQSRGGRSRNVNPNRKDRRKAEREQRKSQKRQGCGIKSGVTPRRADTEADDLFSEEEYPPRPIPSEKEPQKPLKGILKRTSDSEAIRDAESSRSPFPIISRVVKDSLAQENAEIAALEKKLGIKGTLARGAEDDGLEDLFGDFGGGDSEEDIFGQGASKRTRTEDHKWLARKRRKALGSEVLELKDDDASLDGLDELDFEKYEEEKEMHTSLEDTSNFAGFGTKDGDDSDEDEVQGHSPAQFRTRENPYVAPVLVDAAPVPKYVPPSLRTPPSSDEEALLRLRRQTQGFLNRLSDANMLTILRDVEQIYQNNARGYVNTTVIDLLIGLLADETTLLDTFLILHAGFIAAIYKVIGPDFGAQIVERIVSEFDRHYERNSAGSGKQVTNMISLIAQLYSFQVVGTSLVFDYIKLFLDELSEINIELLLRIIKVSGAQLRQDDPKSLKEIVLLLQRSVAKVGESNLPVRTKFMIETINNLKNNRMKTGIGTSNMVNEYTTRMKKQLGTLNARNLRGTEPLRVGLADVKDIEKKGKWWLVGASWRHDTLEQALEREMLGKTKNPKELDMREAEDGEIDLVQLAREQGMNTDIRRAIFVTIMSATDCKDAHVRLMKLNLRKSQEMEIPRVLVHCAGCEQSYNPYYTLVARKFCSDHKLRKVFQFTLWDVFKGLGEKKDGDDTSAHEDEPNTDATSLRRLVNLGKLFGTLIANDCLPISSLKALNFPYLQSKAKTFVEIVLVTVILQSGRVAGGGRDNKRLLEIFIKVDAAPQMITGLQFFLKKVISKSDIMASSAEKEAVKRACKSVVAMMTRLMASTTLDEE